MIKILLIGNLGKDATINTVNGKQVINFNVAHTEKWKDAQGQPMAKTTWCECAYWSDSRISDYLKKGQQVFVEGQPEAHAWQTQDGKSGATLKVRVFSIQLLGSAPNQGQNNAQGQNTQNAQNAPVQGVPMPLEDLPF